MKYLIFPGEEPASILDKSYVTNIQIECADTQEALDLIADNAGKDWGAFSISRGGNETEYAGYALESVVVDFGQTLVVHFILTNASQSSSVAQIDYETGQYVQAAKILMGEST